ncbi:hypothetical protein EMIHUDRAFT_237124 [Emiliania huxleyi CCMP1516]|uniref:ACT domain-containing protein n=2 Tax=Emiliania huxleyi TaxID=2903 RepID=A0A0D3JRG7_EMIH1|nr:hypothetical protein EMIHUDRAFT_237124 [Emiliania huxleyi CCMP1516]EOD26102.1 hypothetical protein EMIHUDRAFT_237124 [Emiliania huxleyi CCMP1516]|eukprot:XP_005778531.1 hypothetical protein EMIHUDRAFT_237124 [Emiliania huxleyi CCMP1516]
MLGTFARCSLHTPLRTPLRAPLSASSALHRACLPFLRPPAARLCTGTGGRTKTAREGRSRRWGPVSVLETVPAGLVFLDYLGTAAFAASGCLVAGQAGMDTLGCVFVGTITALGGGTVRDVLLGRLPVFWFRETSFLLLSIGVGLATFFGSESLETVGLLRADALFLGDTLGLGAFAVVGAQAAISAAMPFSVCCLCGMLTATCGILYSGEGEAGALYAPTALAGAALYAGLVSVVARPAAIVLGVGSTIAMRSLAYSYRVRLPAMERFVSSEQESAPQPGLAVGDAHIFVTAYGADRLGLVARLSECISAARANISASKIITIGDDIAFMMVVSAPSGGADALRKSLVAAGRQGGLRVETSRIDVSTPEGKIGRRPSLGGAACARVELLGVDQPGLVSRVSSFLATHGLNIQSLDSRVYSGAAHATDGGDHGAPGHAARRTPSYRQAAARAVETGVSRAVTARAEGDLFCLSAVVSSERHPDFAQLQAEAAAFEARHGVSLTIQPLEAAAAVEQR